MTVISIGGQVVTVGSTALRAPDWASLATWTHSWDARDSRVVDGRVVYVSDPSGHLPLRTFPGDFALLGADIDTYGPLPGPVWLPSSPRFNGRPALFCDPFDAPSLFNTFAGLTPNVDLAHTTGPEVTGNYFNPPLGYPQPYWVAVLARIGTPDDPEGSDTDTAGVWDATHGGEGTGPTIGRKIVGLGQPNWQFSNFGPGLQLITVAHTATDDETVLIFCSVDGASSFLEVNWRDAGGTLQTLRQTGTMPGWNYLECFLGWVHGQYWSAAAIALGAPNETDLNRVRRWSSYWIPPAGELP